MRCAVSASLDSRDCFANLRIRRDKQEEQDEDDQEYNSPASVASKNATVIHAQSSFP